MEFEPGSISQLSQFISHVVAPAFLLGAVGNFISILTGRMDGVMARLRFINDLPAEDYAKSLLRIHIARLRRRA